MNEQRRYTTHFIGGMVVYAALLITTVFILRDKPDVWWRFPIVVLPVIPVIFSSMAVVRRMRSLDELQRRIQLEAISFAFLSTAILTFTYGLLEGVGFPHLDWTFVLPLMAALWGIGLFFATRRYR